MHTARPSISLDAVFGAAPRDGAVQIEIDVPAFYYRRPMALPKNEVVVKNCKAAPRLSGSK